MQENILVEMVKIIEIQAVLILESPLVHPFLNFFYN